MTKTTSKKESIATKPMPKVNKANPKEKELVG